MCVCVCVRVCVCVFLLLSVRPQILSAFLLSRSLDSISHCCLMITHSLVYTPTLPPIYRFVESEVELDEELQKLQVLAASPELFSLFASLNVIPSIVNLLTHENNDIVIDTVDLLNELCSADNFQDPTFDPMALVRGLVCFMTLYLTTLFLTHTCVHAA